MKRAILLLLFTLFLTDYIFAIQQNYSFTRIRVEDGLSQSWVSSVEQDRLGFMWFGTRDGLNKYDGYTFTVFKYDPANQNSIANNQIQALELDGDDKMWVGTIAGLCYFNQTQNTFKTIGTFTKNPIHNLLFDDGKMYVASAMGLYIYNTKNDSLLTKVSNDLNQQFKSKYIYSLNSDKKGNIWIGTDKGVYKYNPNQNSLISEKSDRGKTLLTNQRINSIEIDHKQRVWIGTTDEGLFMLPESIGEIRSEEFVQFTHTDKKTSSIAKGSILALKADRDGNLWVGTENGGLDRTELNKINTANPIFYHHKHNAGQIRTISNNSIYCIFEDANNDIWVSTYGGGVNFLNSKGGNFSLLQNYARVENSLKHNFVNAIKTFDDELWMGTEGGVSILNLKTKKYRHYVHLPNNDQSLSVNAVMSIFRDSKKNTWVGTWAGGINKLNFGSNSFQHFKHNAQDSTSIALDNVFTITEDKKGIIWSAILDGGLNRFDPKTNEFSRYMTTGLKSNEISSNKVNDICINQKGEIWYTTDISVGYFDSENDIFHNFFPNNQDSTTLVGTGAFVVYEDSKGTMWFGTDAGLNYFDNKTRTFHSYLEKHGLPNNSVKSIVEDNNGNIWMGTNKGLSCLMNGVEKPFKPIFKNYDVHDGLQGNEFNRRAAHKDKNGVLYFGGTNGVSFFNPENISKNRTEPRIVLTNFEVFNRPVKIGSEDSPLNQHISTTKNVVLKHKHSVFTIEFAAISYQAKEKNIYSYKLEGFDNEWNNVGSQRRASFTNLDAGDYTFKVNAANSDGVWTKTPLELQIKVLPPWWKSKIALGSYLLGLLLSLYLFIRISMMRFKEREEILFERQRREQMEELNQKKLQFFTNISHEFKTPLTLIYSPLEDILRNQHHRLPSDLKQKFSIIYKNALRLNRLIGELMDFRKNQFGKLNPVVYNQDLNNFTQNICTLFSEEAAENLIALNVNTPEETVKAWFDPAMIEKVLFNLITNALKVTPENGSIELRVFVTNEQPTESETEGISWTCVSVKDTGLGLKPEEKEKIFERFYQADSYTKRYYSGTGIGLSLAKSIMELHKGYITVESEWNSGADFTIWLRDGKLHFQNEQVKTAEYDLKEQTTAITHESLKVITEGETSTAQKFTVLIVDDNAELRKYLKSELGQSFKILIAKNGQEGIEMALRYYPDIIISDVIMPEKDGYQLCEEVKTNLKLSHIPVILLTAKGAIEDQLKGIKTGADDFIVKPFNTGLLKAKVKHLIASREQLIKKYSTEINLLSEEATINSVDRNFLKEVNQYIVEHLNDPDLSVEQVGEKMAISRSQLYRKIKALSGISVNEYIRSVRLETAKKYITSKQFSINEVVYKVGFSSPSYFSKCYKEHFGVLPSEE